MVREDENKQSMDLNDLFSMRKPKDAAAGLSSGSKSILKGVSTMQLDWCSQGILLLSRMHD